MIVSSNSNAKSINALEVDKNVRLVKIDHKKKESGAYQKDVSQSFIQFHFCLKGKARLQYGPHYGIDVLSNNALLLYNPNQQLPVDLTLAGGSKYIILLVGIEVFHSYFSKVSGLIPFLNEDNKQNKYYADKNLAPNEIIVLNQLFANPSQNTLESLFVKAKVYELLSLYFHKSEPDVQHCPFLNSETNVEKIRLAKKIVIEEVADPPSLSALAMEVGLSLTKLKEGFKQIYGDSVFNFLLDYKLEESRKLLIASDQNVSEIALQMGYSTSSHFISAFKKKFGTTPKQYVKSTLR